MGDDLPPLVLPTDDRPERWYAGTPGILTIAAVALAAVAIVLLAALPEGRGVAATMPEPPTDSRPAPGGEPDAGADGVTFLLAADSLSLTLDAYRQRQSDFERNRIDCSGLATGYRRVNDRVLAVARERAALGDPIPRVEEVFDEVMADASEADRLFDASGCPRP